MLLPQKVSDSRASERPEYVCFFPHTVFQIHHLLSKRIRGFSVIACRFIHYKQLHPEVPLHVLQVLETHAYRTLALKSVRGCCFTFPFASNFLWSTSKWYSIPCFSHRVELKPDKSSPPHSWGPTLFDFTMIYPLELLHRLCFTLLLKMLID